MPSYRMDKPTCPLHPYAHLSELGCVMCNGMSLASKQKLRDSKTGKKRRGKDFTMRGLSGYSSEPEDSGEESEDD